MFVFPKDVKKIVRSFVQLVSLEDKYKMLEILFTGNPKLNDELNDEFYCEGSHGKRIVLSFSLM